MTGNKVRVMIEKDSGRIDIVGGRKLEEATFQFLSPFVGASSVVLLL